MIVGIGIDVVDIGRFGATLQRSPRLLDRLFTDGEQGLALPSLAARFAAKEALAKALGAPVGLSWTDATVRRGEHGRPELDVRGSVAARAAELGVTRLHLTMSHDAGIASAMVLAEGLGGSA
ncbi:MAG TPA: holo-ACP synthase [Dermatophilaceae bacterium]|mgnify:CR=1 FL=1|nr:holo-ACP synthase [Dermatophilaceae bacterium]